MFAFTFYRELYLDEAIKEAEQLFEFIKKPHTNETFSSMAKKTLFSPMTATIRPLYDKLQHAKLRLDSFLRGPETHTPQRLEQGISASSRSQVNSEQLQGKSINKVWRAVDIFEKRHRNV